MDEQPRMIDPNESELTTLQLSVRQGTVTAAQAEAIITLLADREGQRRWLAASMVDRALNDWREDRGTPADPPEDERPANHYTSSEVGIERPTTRAFGRRGRSVMAAGGLILAAMMGWAASTGLLQRDSRESAVRSTDRKSIGEIPASMQMRVRSASGSVQLRSAKGWQHAGPGAIPAGTHQLRTGVASTATLQIGAEGTTIDLQPATELRWSFASGTVIEIPKGEASFDVAPQPAGRPMLIQSDTTLAEVIGTRLTAAVRNGRTRVAVQEGSVVVAPRGDRNARGRLVEATEQIVIDATGSARVSAIPMAGRLELGLIGHWTGQSLKATFHATPKSLYVGPSLKYSPEQLRYGRIDLAERQDHRAFCFPDCSLSSDRSELERQWVLRTGVTKLPRKFSIAMSAWLAPGAKGLQTLAANAASGDYTPGFKWFVHHNKTIEKRQQMVRDGSVWLEMGTGRQTAAVRTGPGVVAEGRWHHLVLVVDNDNARGQIYVDGVDQTIVDRTLPGITDSRELLLAGMAGAGPHLFEGAMTDIRLYDRKLTIQEAAALSERFHAHANANPSSTSATQRGSSLRRTKVQPST